MSECEESPHGLKPTLVSQDYLFFYPRKPLVTHNAAERKFMKSRQDCHGMKLTMNHVLVHHISGIKDSEF